LRKSSEFLNLREVLRELHPYFIIAGKYLLNVQKNVRSVAKEGKSVFTSALTDADLSVQNFFEVLLLALCSDCALDSEESARSINAKYFPKKSKYRFILDPVDGTKSFKDGSRNFGIVLTVILDERIVAVMMYLPAYDKFFSAVENNPTFVGNSLNFLEKKLRLWELPRSGVFRTDHTPMGIVETINEVIEVKEITRDYNSETWRWPKFGILTGEIDGFFKSNGGVEDWGAIAFLAEHAGASVTNVFGARILENAGTRKTIPTLLVSRDHIVHNLVLNALNEKRKK